MSGPITILVEDPGAANFVVGLPGELARLGHRVRLLASGAGAAQLAVLGEACQAAPTCPSSALADNPAAVVVGTAEDPGALYSRLIDEARSAGIRIAAIVDGPANAPHRFAAGGGNPLAHLPDLVLTADTGTADAFVRLGVPCSRVVPCGHPLFDRVRAEAARLKTKDRGALRAHLLPQAPAQQPLIVLLTERSDGLDPDQFSRGSAYTLGGRSGTDRRTDIVLEEVLDALAPVTPRPYVVLRLHPKNDADEFAAYRSEIDHVSTGGTPWGLLAISDLVIGMTSVVMVEAALLGVPTLSVLPRKEERHWLATIDAGVTPCVMRRAEIGPAITALLNKGQFCSQLLDDLYPAGATRRLANALDSMIGGQKMLAEETP